MATGPIFVEVFLPNLEALMSSKLLIEEPPLQFLPSLAKLIGMNEALLLQQIHYQLLRRGSVENDIAWISNSCGDLGPISAVFSQRKIQRIVLTLERKGLLKTRQGVKNSWDRAKYYTIDYDVLNAMLPGETTVSSKPRQHPEKLAVQSPVLSDASTKNTPIEQPELCFSNDQNEAVVYRENKEQRNTEILPARKKSDSDPRWNPIRKDLKLYWETKNPGLAMPFNGRIDGKALAEFLRDFPELTREQWVQCLRHRARSDVVHSEPVRYWIRRLMIYYEGPLDRYGRKTNGGVKHDEQEAIQRNNRENLSRWLTAGSEKEAAPGDISLPVRGLLAATDNPDIE